MDSWISAGSHLYYGLKRGIAHGFKCTEQCDLYSLIFLNQSLEPLLFKAVCPKCAYKKIKITTFGLFFLT